MAQARRRKSCAVSSPRLSPSGSSPTLSCSLTPSHEPLSANSRRPRSANNSPTGIGIREELSRPPFFNFHGQWRFLFVNYTLSLNRPQQFSPPQLPRSTDCKSFSRLLNSLVAVSTSPDVSSGPPAGNPWL